MFGVMDLKKEDHIEGKGAEAKSGKAIVVHYVGYLFDADKEDKKGVKFDSSKDRNEPFDFVLDSGMVIEGWDQGFTGMKEGGKRTLTIPSHMGYGEHGAGAVIPPNATLVFDVELLEVK